MTFEAINLQNLAADSERLSSSQSSFLDQFVLMPEGAGSLRIRILPPAQGGQLYQWTRIHVINGRKLHCPRPLVSGKWDTKTSCPLCDYYRHLWNKSDRLAQDGRVAEADKAKEDARQLKPLERYYYNAIVRSMTVNGQTEHNVGPRIFSVGKDLHAKILKGIVGDKDQPGLGDVSDVATGFDFVVKKEMAGGFPRYFESGFARERSPAGTAEELQRWSTSLHDLAKLRAPKSLTEMEKELAIHRGVIPDDRSFDEDTFDAKWRPVAPSAPTDAAPGAAIAHVPTADDDSLSLADEGILDDLRQPDDPI